MQKEENYINNLSKKQRLVENIDYFLLDIFLIYLFLLFLCPVLVSVCAYTHIPLFHVIKLEPR